MCNQHEVESPNDSGLGFALIVTMSSVFWMAVGFVIGWWMRG